MADFIEITLTQGRVAVVDFADYGLVLGRTFHAVQIDKQCYAATTFNGKRLYLHHLIVGKPSPGSLVDHIDRDGLNNRRKNLRHTNKSQNMRNADTRIDSVSGFRGVGRIGNRWRTKIRIEGRQVHGGYYSTPEEAHAAYIRLCTEHGLL